MTITLPPDLEAFVEAEVASGKYPSTSDVLKHALQMLCDHKRRAELQKQIDMGIADCDAGRTMAFDEAAVERIKATGRALRQEKLISNA